MKAKAHIYQGSSPLGTGSRADVLCGDELWSVHILRVWDTTAINQAIEYPPIGICRKCMSKTSKKSDSRQYVYLIQGEGKRA
jgi:hypothetical protein